MARDSALARFKHQVDFDRLLEKKLGSRIGSRVLQVDRAQRLEPVEGATRSLGPETTDSVSS